MLIPRKEDTIHKAWLFRLLTAICDDAILPQALRFQGGTCSAMRGFIDRFSVDLDFDLIAEKNEIPTVRKAFEAIFEKLGLEIKDQSSKVPQYFLKYPSKEAVRNTIKIDIFFPPAKSNKYESVLLSEIDRTFVCQTRDTLVANKMVAVMERFEKYGSVAGRDIFDIHTYFLRGFEYNGDVIKERSGKSVTVFLEELIKFIEKHVTETLINQDLNHLLGADVFQKIRKVLKTEVLMFLKDELARILKKY